MSNHYEVVFSMFLRDSAPAEVLDELRWHLGLAAQRPDSCVISHEEPQMCPAGSNVLPGGEAARLRRQQRYRRAGAPHYAWGLYARLLWPGDQWAGLWGRVALWLSAHAEDDGYAGFFREEHDERPTLLLIRGGRPYLCEPGGQPHAFS
jgi:hypothetical protein